MNRQAQAVNNMGWKRMKQGDLTQKGNITAEACVSLIYIVYSDANKLILNL